MERGIAPRPRDAAAGFTLLEIVVVVAVISVLSITASFSVGRTGRVTESDAQRFQAMVARLSDAAVLGRRSRALELEGGGWTQLVADAAAEEGWRPSGRGGRFRSDARFSGPGGRIDREFDDGRPRADLVFLPDGHMTPLEVQFIEAGQVTRCATDGWTGLTCARR